MSDKSINQKLYGWLKNPFVLVTIIALIAVIGIYLTGIIYQTGKDDFIVQKIEVEIINLPQYQFIGSGTGITTPSIGLTTLPGFNVRVFFENIGNITPQEVEYECELATYSCDGEYEKNLELLELEQGAIKFTTANPIDKLDYLDFVGMKNPVSIYPLQYTIRCEINSTMQVKEVDYTNNSKMFEFSVDCQ